MATPCLTGDVTAWIDRLARLLDAAFAWRLLPLLTGLLFATGRRTVSSWLRAGELSNDYQDYYYFLGSLGRKVKVAGRRVCCASRGRGRAPATALAGHRRHAEQALRPEGRRGRHPPQPDARTGGAEVRLRPRLGDVGLGGAPSAVGQPSACRCWRAVRPRQGHRGAAPALSREVTFQTKLDMAGGVGRLGGDVAEIPGSNAVGGGRWRLRQEAVLEGSRGGRGDRGQPACARTRPC